MATNPEKAKYAHVILKPRITEKANSVSEKNVHTFEVARTATKLQVRKAVKAFYGVDPIKVSIATNPAKKVIIRGKKGTKQGVKKAYVYLNKKDKIEY